MVLGTCPTVAAQLRGATAPVLAPGVPVASVDDASAVDINPSALGFLDSWSVVYVHAEAADDVAFSRGGDALRLASRLPFGLGVGLSVQSVRPTAAAAASDVSMGSLALGLAPSRQLAAGMAWRWLGSQDGALSGAMAFDLGLSWRPATSLAFSLVGRDLNGPLRLGAPDLPASFLLAAGLRPFGTRVITLDLGGSADTAGGVGLRAALHVEVPYVGRLVASAEARGVEADPELLATAGLLLDWGMASAGGGAIYGEGFGSTPGWFVTAGLSGAEREGLPVSRAVLDVEIAGVDARSILTLLGQLDQARYDDRIAGVLVRLRSSGIGMAEAQELRLAFRALRDAGKPVACHLDAGSGSELYACAAATHTWLDPAGGVMLAGPSSRTILLGDALRLAGLRADFVRIGRFKSAPEQLTNRTSSEGARAQRDELYDDVYDRLVADLARDLGVSRVRVRRLIDQGPYVTPEATALGLARGEADENDLDDAMRTAFGGSFARVKALPRRVARRWGVARRVGVVVVDGDIVDGENVDLPFVGVHMSGGRTVSSALDSLAADPSIAAIVLRVDSPGGSALASDQIWRAVMRARRRKPVIASMGAVAASGGYYVASGADEIWADASTVTGSIGIFFGKVDVVGLADRLGVSIEHVARGRHAGFDSIWRPLTPEERLIAARKIRIWYRLFLRRVAEGRAMEIDDIDRVGRGHVWSGDAALRVGLVDHLGGYLSALGRARALAELDTDAEVVVVPSRPATLLDYVVGGGGSSGLGGPEPPVMIPAGLREAMGAAAALASVRDGVAVARLPALLTPP